jgi:hypothetical protein
MSLSLIETQTVSAVTTVNFTSGIFDPLNNYMISYSNVTYSNEVDSKYIRLRISTDGGMSYIATNYLDLGQNTDGIQCMAFFESNPGPATTVFNAGNIWLYNLTSGSGMFSLNTYGHGYNSDTYSLGPTVSSDQSYGIYTVSGTVINALEIGFSDGVSTISGTFSLYSIDS